LIVIKAAKVVKKDGRARHKKQGTRIKEYKNPKTRVQNPGSTKSNRLRYKKEF